MILCCNDGTTILQDCKDTILGGPGSPKVYLAPAPLNFNRAIYDTF